MWESHRDFATLSSVFICTYFKCSLSFHGHVCYSVINVVIFPVKPSCMLSSWFFQNLPKPFNLLSELWGAQRGGINLLYPLPRTELEWSVHCHSQICKVHQRTWVSCWEEVKNKKKRMEKFTDSYCTELYVGMIANVCLYTRFSVTSL